MKNEIMFCKACGFSEPQNKKNENGFCRNCETFFMEARKQCPYCQREGQRNLTLLGDYVDGHNNDVVIENGRIVYTRIENGEKSTASKKINFCPICGRKMEVK